MAFRRTVDIEGERMKLTAKLEKLAHVWADVVRTPWSVPANELRDREQRARDTSTWQASAMRRRLRELARLEQARAETDARKAAKVSRAAE